MSSIGVIDFLYQKKIIGISVILSALTFGFISKIVEYIYDPLFDYFFPKNKLDDVVIILPNDSRVELGYFFLEIVRWLIYMIVTYQILKGLFKEQVRLEFGQN